MASYRLIVYDMQPVHITCSRRSIVWPTAVPTSSILSTPHGPCAVKPDPVPDELIRKILEAGIAAANGGNRQTWRFLVIKDRAIKERVQHFYKRAFDEVVGPRYRNSAPPPVSLLRDTCASMAPSSI